MLTLYMICAVAGSVVLLLQLGLTVLGMDGHSDIDVSADVPHDMAMGDDFVDHGHGGHDSSWFFGVITFRSLVAALAFFGLGGLASIEFGVGGFGSFLVALASGVAAMIAVAWMLRLLISMHSEGTLNVRQAIAQPGTVYLTVPAARSGVGKVLVTVQDRTVEFEAVTSKETLPTGASITVVGIIGPNTVEVEPA